MNPLQFKAFLNRSGGIRTHGLLVPNLVRVLRQSLVKKGLHVEYIVLTTVLTTKRGFFGISEGVFRFCSALLGQVGVYLHRHGLVSVAHPKHGSFQVNTEIV